MNIIRTPCSVPDNFFFDLTKFGVSRIFVKIPYIKFFENPSSESRDVTSGQTDIWNDMVKLICYSGNYGNKNKKSGGNL
jgi:hypothetical protein